ncbi:AAA+-type ATPase [Basidiobolus ranarum]|uniref:AAA+-type ATPase n=1 Tax=Basidiobolus ranarum TaxID=34480 RepID=A0ABR2X472_9FUNG
MATLIVDTNPHEAELRTARKVFMALDVMRRHNFITGEPVLLCSNLTSNDNKNPTAVGIAWPSLTLEATRIQISSSIRLNCQVKIGDQVKVSKLNSPVVEALKLVLVPELPLEVSFGQALSIYAREMLLELKYIVTNQLVVMTYLGKPHTFRAIKVSPDEGNDCGVYRVTKNTMVSISQDGGEKNQSSVPKVRYDSIGGLEKEVKIVREMVELPLQNPDIYHRFGLKPPKGVLLFGPPGTGKTLIARAVASETQSHVICVNGPEILSKFYGETEAKLRAIFEEAEENSPTIIFIDEIDALCPKRDDAPNELEKRVVATLLTLMDGVAIGARTGRVVIIGATNRPNALDEALRRPGRFDREVEIGIPNANARASILEALLRRIPNTLEKENVQQIAAITHGYVGADLVAVCREAGLKTIKRTINKGADSDKGLFVNYDDMRSALSEIRPSAMREIMIEVPKVYWTDIGGMEEVKMKLKESVEWPLQHPEAFERMGIRPPKGVLLYGPPGCSKTLMAKALATEAGLNFIAVKGPELFSKWVGESEKAVREVFRKARASSPSIVFFDEIDALTVKRGSGQDGTSVADRVLSQLLNELDGVEPLINVTVVAATNRPDIIDSALLRPGRIDRILYISPPDIAARREILRIQFNKMPCASDVNIDELTAKTDGCSGAEIVALCQEAALCAMNENHDAKQISHSHFVEALGSMTRRITPEMIKFYDDFRKRSGLKSV